MAELAANELKEIFYDNTSKFIITPKIRESDIDAFNKHYEVLKKTSECDMGNFYFWRFDPISNSIIVNENTNLANNDVFNQFCSLSYWLFRRKYNLRGQFYCRFDNYIEYISVNGRNSAIVHHILIDNSAIPKNLNNSSDIMNNAIFKMKRYLKKNYKNNRCFQNKKEQIISNQKNKSNDKKVNSNINGNKKINQNIPTYYFGKKEQNRLTIVENKIKSLTVLNKTLWKIYTIITFVTFSSIIYYTLIDSNTWPV